MYLFVSPKAMQFVKSSGKVAHKRGPRWENIAIPRVYGRVFTAMLLGSTAKGL